MWIETKVAFIDKHAEGADAEVPAGKKLNVTAERGQELIDLGFAEPADGHAVEEPTQTED